MLIRKMFKRIAVHVGIVSLLGSFAAGAQEIEVPHSFSPDTPAKAEEVNANFSYVTEQLDQLLSRFEASPAQVGVFHREVNCSEDPFALRDAYREGAHFADVRISIEAGSCFGQYWAGASNVRFGQVVSIFGAVTDKENWPRIIPHPEANSAMLQAPVGGGLRLARLHIEAGVNDANGVYFADNQFGTLSGVTITGHGTGVGVRVREGATVGLNDVEIVNFDRGIIGINSANVVTWGGPIVVRHISFIGIDLNFSTMQQAGPIEIDAGEYAVMSNSSVWNVWETSLTTTGTGSVHLNRNSTMTARELSNEIHINVDNSTLMVNQLANINGISAGRGSLVALNGGSASGTIRISRSSIADLESFSAHDVDVLDQSSLNINNTQINGRLHLSNANANIAPSSTINFNELRCYGLSSLSIHDVDLLRDYPETRCLTGNDVDRFYDIVRGVVLDE